MNFSAACVELAPSSRPGGSCRPAGPCVRDEDRRPRAAICVDLGRGLLDDHGGLRVVLRGAASRAWRGCGRGPRSGRACRRSAAAARARRSSRSAARSARGRSSSRFWITSGLSSSRWRSGLPSLVAHALVLGRVERRRGRCGRLEHCAPAGQALDRRSSSGASISSAAVSRRPRCSSSSASASACATLRGKPSSRKPSSPSLVDLVEDHRDHERRRARACRRPCTSWPRLPSSVSSSTCSRRRSPVAM